MRKAIAVILAIVMSIGPTWCCCTVARGLSQLRFAAFSLSKSRVTVETCHSCCGTDATEETTHEPQPVRDSPCPCRQDAGICGAQAVGGAAKIELAHGNESIAPMLVDASLWFDCVTDALTSADSQFRMPFLSAHELRCAHHLLRC